MIKKVWICSARMDFLCVCVEKLTQSFSQWMRSSWSLLKEKIHSISHQLTSSFYNFSFFCYSQLKLPFCGHLLHIVSALSLLTLQFSISNTFISFVTINGHIYALSWFISNFLWPKSEHFLVILVRNIKSLP